MAQTNTWNTYWTSVLAAGMLAVVFVVMLAAPPAGAALDGPPPAGPPSALAAPTATHSLPRGYPQVCSGLERLGVPPADVEAALEDPSRIPGWNAPANPNRPTSWTNPRKRHLSLSDPNKPYHPLYNGLVYKAGCRHR